MGACPKMMGDEAKRKPLIDGSMDLTHRNLGMARSTAARNLIATPAFHSQTCLPLKAKQRPDPPPLALRPRPRFSSPYHLPMSQRGASPCSLVGLTGRTAPASLPLVGEGPGHVQRVYFHEHRDRRFERQRIMAPGRAAARGGLAARRRRTAALGRRQMGPCRF